MAVSVTTPGYPSFSFSSVSFLDFHWNTPECYDANTAQVAINLFGVKGYGEAEFIFAVIKVTAVIGFIILGVVSSTHFSDQNPYLTHHRS